MHSTLSFHPLRLLSIPLLLLFNIRGDIEETETEASVGRCPSANPNKHIAGQTWDDGVPDALGIHRFSLPDLYKADQQMPLLLYFHGWGDDVDACGSFCNVAQERGFATISLQGTANVASGEYRSWNTSGSTQSSTDYLKRAYDWTKVSGCDETAQAAENGRSCNNPPYDTYSYQDCHDTLLDDCGWTTCTDSIDQTLRVLNYFMDQFCIDTNMIWAVGCSNGGMFLYELARDSRTASIFAGITPMVGLPAYGFNFGPTSPISFFGSWGLKDDVVPPEVGASALNCTLPCRTSQSNGWFYESSECTTDEWQDVLGLDQAVDAGNFGNSQNTACWKHFSAISDVEVVGCHFSGGHDCNKPHQVIPMLDFMESHPKSGASTQTTEVGPKPRGRCRRLYLLALLSWWHA